MDKLTTEDLEPLVDRLKRCLDHLDENNEIEIIMDREGLEECISALSHRNSAAAGDEEVDELTVEAGNGIGTDYYIDKRGCSAATESLNKLRDIAIARGRTRTDAVNRAAEWAKECEGLEQTIATLTAERDEARKEVEQLRMAVGCATTIKGDMVMRADDPLGMMQEVCAYVKSLRSCPEMGEVDAIEDWLEGKEIEFGVVRRIKRLVEMVGQLSAALTEERKRGDEVAGLLRWWVEFKDGFGQLEGISVGSAVNEWKENARRILAICGKEVGT